MFLAFTIATAAFAIGYILTKKSSTQVATFEPKVAAEILRNCLQYTYEDVTTPEEQESRLDRVRLDYKGEAVTASAFERAAILNAGGFAILGPKTMWEEYQPWTPHAAQLLFIEASNDEAIQSMASPSSPWAVIVRKPNVLSRFQAMLPSQVMTELKASDIA